MNRRATDQHAAEPSSVSSSALARSASEAPPAQPRNFLVLAMYQVVMRTGWIFKTESIIMPAVLDMMVGTGWARGCLPALNRFGQSVPPLLLARRIKITRRKKWAFVVCSAVMSAAVLGWSAIWMIGGGSVSWWMPVLFLALYAVFFMSTGVNHLCFSTLQGKLIQTNLRGRLFMTAHIGGALCAIVCASLLLPLWLRPTGGDFGLVFGVSGLLFTASAVTATFLRESPDDFTQPVARVSQVFASAWQLVRHDVKFRRLAAVAVLFGTSMMVFPHYQALGRTGDAANLDQLILWVIVQNAGTALFSLPTGPLADWRGNRAVLRVLMLGVCSAPFLAVLLHALDGASLFFLVFLFVGLTPVTIRTLNNYTLEICGPHDHTRYLSTLSLCVATPVILLSPVVGGLVDVVGFEFVFLTIGAVVFIGWLLTFRLSEPRHHLHEPAVDSPATTE